MITHNFNTLDLLTSPVWIVSPFEEQLIYANSAARLLMQDLTFSQLRTGPYSVSSQKELPKYLSDLQNQHDIIEILTVQRKEEETALSCRLVLRELTETEPVIIFEGIEAPATLGLKASRSANYQRKKQGFYARFFLTNSAPMLLIDPSRDGQIVDANLAALNFYGYNHETMCQKHTWEINMLGRRVMPIMHEISHLPGGHKPLNFVHKLADGSTRHVQTYAGPIEIYGDKLMLCIVHDITEQKRLEEQLEHAAHHDAMTGLLNRRQFYHITEPGQMQHLAIAQAYSLLLIDTAAVYGNEDAVGEAVREAISEGLCTREELFITSKLWVQDMLNQDIAAAGIEASLKKSGLEYFDLYLLHQAMRDYFSAWRALEDAYEEGKLKAIGVSNFYPHVLANFCETVRVKPMVNQVELHPYFAQPEALATMKYYNVQPEAWAPLGGGRHKPFENNLLQSIADAHQKSISQVILRWNIQRGVVVIPKSTHQQRIEENFAIWDFSLTEKEMAQISSLDLGYVGESVKHFNPEFVRGCLAVKIHD